MKKLLYSTSSIVLLYFICMVLGMLWQIFLGLAETYEVCKGLTANASTVPLEVWAWGWVSVLSFYIGVDRAVMIKKSTTLEYGQVDVGEPSKLRSMIFFALGAVILSWIGDNVTAYDFCQEEFVAAFVAGCSLYVAGQKGIQTARWTCPKEKDQNSNGIPDEDEAEFSKWARTERKNGTEEKFITYDYFLDWKSEQK